MKSSSEKSKYVVKYLGIVEGTIGCLTRKMVIPAKEPEFPAGFIPSTKRIKLFREKARNISVPILRKQYTSKTTTTKNEDMTKGTLGVTDSNQQTIAN